MRSQLILLLLLAVPSVAAAQNYSVVYSFGGTHNGYSPETGLVADAAGNLYGTTTYGGANDFGTVFELPITGGEKMLHNFSGNWDGAYPVSGVVLDNAGNLYGTAKLGGYPNCGDIGSYRRSETRYQREPLRINRLWGQPGFFLLNLRVRSHLRDQSRGTANYSSHFRILGWSLPGGSHLLPEGKPVWHCRSWWR